MKNTKKYWLRGGISLFVLTSILGLLNYRCFTYNLGLSSFKCIPFELQNIVARPFQGLIISQNFPISNAEIVLVQTLIVILSIILWTFIGMFIGWIYGKIKNKN